MYEMSLSCWLQIPLGYFVISTAIGLQPTNIVFVQAGASLSNLHSWRDLYGPRSIMLLTLCLLAALLPILVRRHWLKIKPGAAPNHLLMVALLKPACSQQTWQCSIKAQHAIARSLQTPQ